MVGGEVSLDMGESGAAEQGASWVRLEGRESPSFHTTVSGVLLRLWVLPLHPLQRSMLAIQRSLRAGGFCMSRFLAVSDNRWLLVALTCCHMLGCLCCSATEICSACVSVLALRLRSILVQAGSRLCSGAMTTSMELLEREKIGAHSSSSPSPTIPASLEKETD